MKTIEKAEELAKMMIRIGKLANKETVCILTNMNEPIGHSIGNTLEVIEAIEALNGNMDEDVMNCRLPFGSVWFRIRNLLQKG